MIVEFQPGDLVANKANPKVPYTFLQMKDDTTAVVMDGENERQSLPVVVLIKYDPPKPPTIRSVSIW